MSTNAMTVILGGVEVEARLRDDTIEKVKVRQLPISLIDQWVTLQGDESSLVELYCDRRDNAIAGRLQLLRVQELRLLAILGNAEPEQFDGLDERLLRLRERIVELEEKPRWADQLLPESHTEILRIGEELNRPIFDRWARDRTRAIGQMKQSSALLEESLSAISPPSAASSSDGPT